MPRTLAYLQSAPDDEIVAALGKSRPPGLITIQAAISHRRAALERHESAQLESDLASLDLALARRAGYRTREGQARLERVVAEARAALALAPAQPFTWTTLVHATMALDAGRPLPPLYRMAVRTAPYDPALVVQRIELALLGDSRLDAESRALRDEQIRIVARLAPKELVQLVKRRHALGPIRAVLAPTPALKTRFDAAYLASVR